MKNDQLRERVKELLNAINANVETTQAPRKDSIVKIQYIAEEIEELNKIL